MPSKTVSLALLTLWLVGTSSAVSAQSLADVAKKERERRARNDEKGVESRTFSETEIFGEDDDETSAEAEAPEEGAPQGEPTGDGELASASDPFQVDIDLSPSADGREDASSRAREGDEDYWRARMSAARQRVEAARKNKAVLDGIHYVPGTSFVDESGNVIIGSLADLRRMVDRADAELASAEQALTELGSEARRAGVPPGWLR